VRDVPRSYSLDRNLPTAFQRLPDYVRDDVWIRDFLHRGKIAHVASLWDDQPFITPTTYLFDEADHRLIFHSNITGRIQANIKLHPKVCLEVSELGRFLPSNVALEFSLQYRSVIVFGSAFILDDRQEKREIMHRLIAKYFDKMELGRDYRPAIDKELDRTSVYEIRIESWSGKENWNQRADQSDEWPELDAKWYE
jgi:nitroimidazol reductase NimA-like FMN-containing flavoprotein (pyridoxamine 5'-phosphate oxidase superfamily)